MNNRTNRTARPTNTVADADPETRSSPPDSIESMLSEMGIQRRAGVSLVLQIIHAIEAMVNDGRLRTGMRMPSVRSLARAIGVSTFTVVEA